MGTIIRGLPLYMDGTVITYNLSLSLDPDSITNIFLYPRIHCYNLFSMLGEMYQMGSNLAHKWADPL